jgi:hypothetical protein
MKQGTGASGAIGAIVSSLAMLGCCVPLGFAGAIGAASASAFIGALQPWLLGLSIASLGFGFWQQRRAKVCSLKSKRVSELLLWAAVITVVSMALFPQQIGAFLTGTWRT